MSQKTLKEIDDIDSRRELHILLEKLNPDQRISYLYWAMETATENLKVRNSSATTVTITNATGDYVETYLDLMSLVFNWGLNLNDALPELERRVAEARKLFDPNRGAGAKPSFILLDRVFAERVPV